MKDAQKPDHVSLTTLINRLGEGRFVVPDFQREFEWEPCDIRDLIRSIFLDYYIGSLLLWKGKEGNFEALACEPIYGFNGVGDPTHIVLDGQQRLTAMYYVFCAPDVPAPGRQKRFFYFIRIDQFMDEAYDEAFVYDWTNKSIKLIKNQNMQFESHMFPLVVVGEGGWSLANWVQNYEKYWSEKRKKAIEAGEETKIKAAEKHINNARDFGMYVNSIVQQYQITYIELDQDLEIDKVCDIFTQINSRGIRLDAFDLINALLKPKGLQLKHMWREASSRLNFVETDRMNVYILQVMSIIRQTYCSPKYLYYLLPGQVRKVRNPDGSLSSEILISDIDDFKKLWNKALGAMIHAIELLRHPQEFGAISSKYLPYVSILPAFAALQVEAQSRLPEHQLSVQRKIRYWYWASVFTNRYSGSVESTTARDYLDVKAWFDDDSIEPMLISEFKDRFRNLDLRSETKRGSSIYNGIFNLLVLRGARDWVTGKIPKYDDLDGHHIVPQSWGKEKSLHPLIDTILNCTPLTTDTNRNIISGKLPNEYLPKLIERNGEIEVRTILESHFISPVAFEILLRDPFTKDDFEAFIKERQHTILESIEDLLVKELIDLPINLRELDNQIEKIELELRQMIENNLCDFVGELPPHINQKINERLKSEINNPVFNIQYYKTLKGKLEFTDLRDIQDIITNKMLWFKFEKCFRNKELLTKRFNQLIELRNGIRHSRQIGEVTCKEGEAAIIWFKDVLRI